MRMYLDKVDIPEGESGDWKVKNFVVSEEAAQLDFWGMLHGRQVYPGTYTGLYHRTRGVVMSDTPAEQLDHLKAVEQAIGSCLINGLGIGMVLHNILLKKDVTDVTVIELEDDVIKLVGLTYLKDPRVTIIHANAFEWKPPKSKRYDMVWHDVWDSITSDNRPEFSKLNRKYGRLTNWQGCWGKDTLDRERRQYY